jgi:hypothetical protein
MVFRVSWNSVPGCNFISIISGCGEGVFTFKETEEDKAESKIKELELQGHTVIDER